VIALAGNAQATVAFDPPRANGEPITSYTVTGTSSDGGAPATATVAGNLTSVTVTGLTNGDSYTFMVTATNSLGAGPSSGESNAVTPVGPPGAPTAVTATAGVAQATVSFTQPASNGGATITGYTVTATSSDGGVSASETGSDSPITISGLTGQKLYTFTVTATNSAGLTGLPSEQSNKVAIR
jgi:hypothetical protein